MGRDKYARATEVVGGTVGGTVGVALGAEKLRDAYQRDYPKRYAAHAAQAERTASEIAPRAGRLARVASHGHVPFTALVAGSAGAVAATGAKRYRKKRELEAATPVAKCAFGVVHKSESFTQLGNHITTVTGEVDDKVRGLKRKTVPTVPQLVAVASDKTRTTLHKGDRLRRRAPEAVLATGATAAAVGSVRQTNSGRGHLKAASSSAAQRDRNFTFGRASLTTHIDNLEQTAKAKKQKKAVPLHRLEGAADEAHYLRGKYSAGMHHHHEAVRSAARAGESFRAGRTLRLTAAGLGLGAVMAHRHGDKNRR